VKAVTLPAAATAGNGAVIMVLDESGTVGATNTLVVTRAGADTINSATTDTLNADHCRAAYLSDGVSKWTRIW
jgi:hypothetical protein